jgi:putative FmdB family regulatory protein
MPIYEYTCRSCGEDFDALRTVNDLDSEVECPKCSEKNASRKISLSSVKDILKQFSAPAGSCAGRKYG